MLKRILALALPAAAVVPGRVDFHGLLLDSGGQKVNGAVDLVFTLYDTGKPRMDRHRRRPQSAGRDLRSPARSDFRWRRTLSGARSRTKSAATHG
jgi:hypothetical protein